MSDASPNTIGYLENSIEARESGSLENLVKRIRERVLSWLFDEPEKSETVETDKPEVLEGTPENLSKLQHTISVISGELVSTEDLQAIIEASKMLGNGEDVRTFVKSDYRIIHDINEAHENRERLNVPYEQERSRILMAYIGRFTKKGQFPNSKYRMGVKINYKTVPKVNRKIVNPPETAKAEGVVEETRQNVIPMVARLHAVPKTEVVDEDDNDDSQVA